MFEQVISGGQPGVERAALDVAQAAGIACAGWCARGRKADDGVVPDAYPVRETPTAGVVQPIEWNVRDADGTLALVCGELSGAAAVAVELATRMNKPALVIDLDAPASVSNIRFWHQTHGIKTVNVTGTRERRVPGIAQRAAALFGEALGVATPAPANLPGVEVPHATLVVAQSVETIIPTAIPVPAEPSTALPNETERLRWSRFQTAAAIEGAVLYGLYRIPLTVAERIGWMLFGFVLVFLVCLLVLEDTPAGDRAWWHRVRRLLQRGLSGGWRWHAWRARWRAWRLPSGARVLAASVLLMNLFNITVFGYKLKSVDSRRTASARPVRAVARPRIAASSSAAPSPSAARPVVATRFGDLSSAPSTEAAMIPMLRPCGSPPASLRERTISAMRRTSDGGE